MTTNKPEVVAWRWRRPVVNDQGETIGATAWKLGDAPEFLSWWRNEPLIRLSDYEALQAELAELKQTSLFSAGYRFGRDANDAGHTVRLQKEKDALRDECEKLRTALAESRANDLTAMGYLNQIRQLVGGDDFPDMVRRCEKLQAECEKLRMED